jgi:hypothetical protein
MKIHEQLDKLNNPGTNVWIGVSLKFADELLNLLHPRLKFSFL